MHMIKHRKELFFLLMNSSLHVDKVLVHCCIEHTTEGRAGRKQGKRYLAVAVFSIPQALLCEKRNCLPMACDCSVIWQEDDLEVLLGMLSFRHGK